MPAWSNRKSEAWFLRRVTTDRAGQTGAPLVGQEDCCAQVRSQIGPWNWSWKPSALSFEV